MDELTAAVRIDVTNEWLLSGWMNELPQSICLSELLQQDG
jgi:hypothetical protein